MKDITISIDDDLMQHIDLYAAADKVTSSQAIIDLVRVALYLEAEQDGFKKLDEWEKYLIQCIKEDSAN